MPDRRPPLLRHSALFLFLATAATAPALSSPTAQAPTRGIESVYDPGFLLEDRNGDGHVDFVNLCLALPAAPTDGEVVAAANIAARLGYETGSIDLPLPRAGRDGGCDAPLLAIGSTAFAGSVASTPLAELEPGVGTVRVGGGDTPAVVVAGGDDAGTQAAALVLAARLPYLWDPSGETFDDVTDAVRSVLIAGGVDALSITVRRLEVHAGTPGLERADVVIDVPANGLAAAERLLRQAVEAPADVEGEDTAADQGSADAALDEAVADETATAAEAATDDEAGQEEAAAEEQQEEEEEQEVEEPIDLRFTGLRLLRLELTAPGASPAIVWARNDADVPNGGGRRPGGGNKGNLDLSNLYANGGFFSDTDSNLIPDRVDIVLSPAGDHGAVTADLAARLGLEAAGVTIPIAKTAAEIDDPASEPPLVLIGAQHPLIQKLVDDEKLELPQLDPGEGWIAVVRDAFDEKTAVVVTGADEDGLAAAMSKLAVDFPHFLYRGKDRPTVEDVEEGLWRAISSRSPIGQAATALYKLETLAE